MKSVLKSSALIVFVSAVSYAWLCQLVPAVLHRTVSQIRFSEYSIIYISTFNLVSNLHQGGVFLWNAYDQMPLMYHVLNAAFNCSFVKGLIAAAYFMARPYFDSPAVAFHQVFTSGYLFSIMLVQTTGVYLLVRRFSGSTAVLVFSLLLVNIFLSPHLYMGTGAGDIHVYLPLLIHFTLSFFEKPSARAFVRLMFAWIVAVFTIPFIAVQYVYQCVHVFLLACLAVRIENVHVFLKKAVDHPVERLRTGWFFLKKNRAAVFLVMAVAAAVLGPFLALLIGNLRDYTFGGGEKRFEDIFSFYAYFKRPAQFAPKDYFFCDMVNFTMSTRQFRQHWIARWLFMGFIPVFFAWLGILLSKDKRKYVFLITIVLLYLLNAPRNDASMSGFAHWLNALTNPLKFTTRSFHMAGAITLGYFFAPLIVMGLEAVRRLVREKKGLNRTQLVAAGFGVGVVVLATVFSGPVKQGFPWELKQYLIFNALVTGVFLWALCRLRRTVFLPVILSLLLLAWTGHEAEAMGCYMRPVFGAFAVHAQDLGIDGEGPTLPDYQNPEIFPFRYHHAARIIPKLEGYFETEPLNVYGLFARYTNLHKFFEEADKWLPTHRSYGLFSQNKALQESLAKDSRLFFFTRSIEEIRPETRAAPDLRQATYRPADLIFSKAAASRAVRLHSFRLPDDFPKEMSSTIYTDDKKYFEVRLGSRTLTQTQGAPASPFTYDIQNYRTGELVVAVPAARPLLELVRLSYPVRGIEGVEKIVKFTPDSLLFSYEAPAEGWLVFRYPYDEKWKIQVDKKGVDFERVSGCFIGFRVPEGIHEISIRYWPKDWLRGWIVLSTVSAQLLFLGLVFAELGKEPCE